MRIGRPAMFADPRYASARRRVEHRAEVREAITAWTGVRPRAEIVEHLAGRVPCGPVNNAADLAADPHVAARQMYVAIDHPGSARPVLTPNTAIRFATTPGGVYRRAPILDEHRDEILAELEALEALEAQGEPHAP